MQPACSGTGAPTPILAGGAASPGTVARRGELSNGADSGYGRNEEGGE